MDKQQYEAASRDQVAFRKDGDVTRTTRPFLCVSWKLPHPELSRIVIMFAAGFADVLQ